MNGNKQEVYWKKFFCEQEQRTIEELHEDAEWLRRFTEGCRTDMHEPNEQDVYARVVGRNLNNAFGDSGEGKEMVVVLSRGKKELRVNLATLIAVARLAKA